MSSEFLATVAYPRRAPGIDTQWKKVGKLWWDQKAGRASLLLLGWPFNIAPGADGNARLCAARPHPDRLKALGIEAPHIHGDLTAAVGAHEDADGRIVVDRIWCGFVTAAETDKGVLYSIRLDTLPLVKVEQAGIWLKIDENWTD